MAAVISRNDPAFDEALLDRASVAFGVFDGVHEGHRFIIGEAVNTAREEGRASAVITFDIDPDEVFAADRLKKLMTNEVRIAKLAELDVDAVVVLPFSREFAAPRTSSTPASAAACRATSTSAATSISVARPRAMWRACVCGAPSAAWRCTDMSWWPRAAAP